MARINITMSDEARSVFMEKALFLKIHGIRVNFSQLAREGIAQGLQVRIQDLAAHHAGERNYHSRVHDEITEFMK